MKKIFIASLLLLSISGKYSFAATATCNATDQTTCENTAGCYWTPAASGNDEGGTNGNEGTGGGTPPPQGTCSQCPENTWGSGCKTCPDGFPNSAAGSIEPTDCYMTCDTTPIDIEFGQKWYKHAKVNWTPNPTPKTCDDFIEYKCDTYTNNFCMSAHLNDDGNGCVINWTTADKPQPPIGQINNCSKYLQVYFNGDWHTQSACMTCENNYHLSGTVNLNFTCQINDKTLGTKCDANSISCDQLGNPTVNRVPLNDCDDTEGKNYTWDADKQSYDYSACTKKCRVKEGKNTNEYTFSYNGNEWDRGDSTGNTKCDEGSCLMPGETACNVAANGYYAVQNQNNCKPCPGGTTTVAQGATSVDKCVITNATKFCDKTGCFTLPIDVNDRITYF